LRTRRYREHLQRGLSQFGSMLCWFLAASSVFCGYQCARARARIDARAHARAESGRYPYDFVNVSDHLGSIRRVGLQNN
jgi:hypothetical protein